MLKMMRSHKLDEINLQTEGETIEVCGWINMDRDLGGLFFIDIRDKHAVLQLAFDEFRGDMAEVKKWSLESVIWAKGQVRARPEAAKNDKMITGDVELSVQEVKLLSMAQTPPFLTQSKVEAGEDLKLKYRYLDLRGQRLQSFVTLRSKVSHRIRNFFHDHDFIEVETPILYKATPEGARDFVVPSRVHPQKVYALPQSPQTLKQLLMIGGTDRYFQICKCFRDEDLRADRQPEFTQVDVEMSFCTQETIKDLTQKLIKEVFPVSSDFTLSTLSYDEAMSRYGSDKPDLRYDLPHHIMNKALEKSDFKVFRQALDGGGMVKMIFLPGREEKMSRKDLDALVDVVSPFGGKGVAWFKVDKEGKRSGGISKFIQDEDFKQIEEMSLENNEMRNGIYFFLASEKEKVVHQSADALRRFFATKFELFNPNDYAFVWINEFPLLEYDEDDKRFYACHHPFTMPSLSEVDSFLKGENLLKMKAEAYDIVCNGYEMGGGSLRIYDQKLQEKMFEVLSFTPEEAKAKFGFFMEALSYGTPPHGGIAFGLDRLMMLLAKTDNIRDVISFPKTNSAVDLMSQSPSEAALEHLEELHMKWR